METGLLNREYLNITNSTIENHTQNDRDDHLSNNKTSLFIVLLDRSQLVMTIIGVIANVGTSITLIINGKVSLDDFSTSVTLHNKTL